MNGAYRPAAALSLPHLRLEHIEQDPSGPFARRHLLDTPSLVYLPGAGETALGSFTNPESHRSFARFGRVVVVPAGVPLHVRSTGFDAREMIVARFDPARFREVTGLGAAPSPEMLAACVDISAGAIATTMDRVAGELALPRSGGAAILEGLGLVLLGELARYFDGVRARTGARGTLAGWQLARIEARLADDGRPAPSLAELAAAAGISERHLMRGWKAAFGETVTARIEQQRFTRARQLLQEGGQPVKAIAAACGFSGGSAFTAAFRRRFGLTPSEWRARSKAGMHG